MRSRLKISPESELHIKKVVLSITLFRGCKRDSKQRIISVRYWQIDFGLSGGSKLLLLASGRRA